MPYLPPHDHEPDESVLRDFIDRHPLATLITFDGESPDADLIPMRLRERDGELVLEGHVARANRLWRVHQGPALACFGPVEHYVSPTWYPSKAEHHRTVPTWNYLVVHARGELIVHDDRSWVRAQVARLTNAMESRQPEPWRMGQAPADYIDEELSEIVGIELRGLSLVGKFKASAHKNEADRLGARAGIIADSGESELTDRMGG